MFYLFFLFSLFFFFHHHCTWSTVHFSRIWGQQQILFATSRGVWRSYPRCLSTPTLNGIKNKTKTNNYFYRPMSMPSATMRRCRSSRCGRYDYAARYFAAMPTDVDAVCVATLHLLREGNADDTSMLSATRDNASPPSRGKCRRIVDAVCSMRQRFTSFAREMPTNRRCRPSRCGLCGHAVFVAMRSLHHAVFVAMRSLWPCGLCGHVVIRAMWF